jgi:predicted kinase
MTKQLYIMLGYPGSGKSTFARQLADRIGAIRISQDYLRKTTFKNPRDHMTTDDDHML